MASNSRVIVGTLIALAGARFGIFYEGKANKLYRDNPAVQEFVEQERKVILARRDLNILPLGELQGYVPQHERPDYSVAQAHSRVEQAHQKLGLEKGIFEEISDSKAVREYNSNGIDALLCFMVASGGLIFAGSGIRRGE